MRSPICLWNLVGLVALTLARSTAAGQALVEYDFRGAPGNQESTAAAVVNPNVQATDIRRGAGLTPVARTNMLNSSGFATGGLAEAVTGNDYYSFSVTLGPAATSQFSGFDFDTLGVTVWRNSTGPFQFALRTSLDNFAANVDPGTDSSGNPIAGRMLRNLTTPQFFTFNLNGLDELSANQTRPVEFRLYGFASNADTGQLSLTNPTGGNGVILSGSLVPVPEPTLLLGCAALGLVVVRGVRRAVGIL